jgi:hypothetical protein
MSLPLRTGRRYGQVIDARQVPHKGFGGDEGPPNFFVVRVLDRDLADMQDIAGWKEELEDKGETLEGFVIRAAGRIDPNRLAKGHKEKLYKDGVLEVTWAELQSGVMDDMDEARKRYKAKDPTWPHRISVAKVKMPAAEMEDAMATGVVVEKVG